VLRALQLRDLIHRQLERAPAAHRNHRCRLDIEELLHHLGAGHRQLAVDFLGAVVVHRHHLAQRQSVACRQLRGQRQAIGQPVIDTHAYQVLLDRQGDQALRDRPGNAELFRDLVLGIAGHVIQPRRPRGEIEFVGGFGHDRGLFPGRVSAPDNSSRVPGAAR
jgi:hypothetical protein